MTEIKPALTPEEWEARCVRLEEHLGRETAVALVQSHLLLRSHDTWRGEPYTAVVFATPHTVVSIMAIANAALPDDDSRKITRDDVEELRLADERIRGEWDHPNNPEPPTLRNLAAKLAALLPPE